MIRSTLRRSAQVLLVLTLAALAATAASALFQLTRNQIAADIWRDRARHLVEENQKLAERYNRAVQYAAVTELLVGEEQVDVVLRGPDGVIEKRPTPFSPRNEIHVDLIVRNGRVWIRRILEEPRRSGIEPVDVEPTLTEIDWTDERIQRGHRIYHGGLTPGRWAVTVSGNGAMDLIYIDDDSPSDLVYAPHIYDFKEIERDAGEELRELSNRQILARLFGLD